MSLVTQVTLRVRNYEGRSSRFAPNPWSYDRGGCFCRFGDPRPQVQDSGSPAEGTLRTNRQASARGVREVQCGWSDEIVRDALLTKTWMIMIASYQIVT